MTNFSDKSTGGIIRGIALLVMIGTVVLGDAILYWQHQVVWGIFWSCIIALVLGFEVYGKFISKQKLTISNMWRDWIVYEKDNKKFPWGRITLIIIWVSFTALIVHLWFF